MVMLRWTICLVLLSIRYYPVVTTSVEKTTEERATTESERNNGPFSTVTSSLNFTELWQNKSLESTTPRVTPQAFTDKWTSIELTKSSTTEMESSTLAFTNNISSSVTTSSSIKSIFDKTTESEREQFSTKTELPSTSKSTITPECQGILCPSSTVSPTRNDSDASVTLSFLPYLNFLLPLLFIITTIFFSVTVHIVKTVNLDQL